MEIIGLEKALSEASDRYKDAIEYHNKKLKNFCGMNIDKPSKGQAIVVFEAAQAHLAHLKASKPASRVDVWVAVKMHQAEEDMFRFSNEERLTIDVFLDCLEAKGYAIAPPLPSCVLDA